MINEHLSNLRSLLAREHRWAGEYAEEDRIANIAALEWAIEQCSGHEPKPLHAQGCPCPDCLNGTTRSNIPQNCICRPVQTNLANMQGWYATDPACPIHGSG